MSHQSMTSTLTGHVTHTCEMKETTTADWPRVKSTTADRPRLGLTTSSTTGWMKTRILMSSGQNSPTKVHLFCSITTILAGLLPDRGLSINGITIYGTLGHMPIKSLQDHVYTPCLPIYSYYNFCKTP